ncbi:hypothetical protein [Amphritea sp. HPY]|uniref:hypothetical protein n=1 Tax=Amphritea sp. HPY TaxID=3421652 RepID=UPI003D7DE2F3
MAKSWVVQAKQLFSQVKPEHFTDYRHCDECGEHDQTLLQWDVDSIGLAQLGNPGWDPICFCSCEGKQYYLPAMIRLTLDTIETELYLEQLLFHLSWDGENNAFYLSCSLQQRQFIAAFIVHLTDHYTDQVEQALCTDDLLRVYQIWSQ